MNIIFKILIIILLYVSNSTTIFGQRIMDTDAAMKKAKELGIPQSQVESIINDQSIFKSDLENEFSKKLNDLNNKNNPNKMTSDKINSDLKKDLLNTVNINSNSEVIVEEITSKKDENDRFKKEDSIDSSSVKESIKNLYFGYNIFYQDPELFQPSADLTIGPNYLISPGDEIIVMLWGETEINQSFSVSREGYLFIDNLGQIFVNGLTINELEKKLFNQFKKIYSSLGEVSGTNRTYLDVSLGKSALLPMRIFVLGSVDQPGAYSVKTTSSIFSSFYYFNGPSIDGSLRNVKLIRDGKEISSVDFYDFLLSGKKSKDLRLQRDDIIFIPNRGKTVTVKGEIRKPYIYELKDGENLDDLINISGGLLPTTYLKRGQIERIVPPSKRGPNIPDRRLIDIDLADKKAVEKIKLFDGDKIEFFKISDEIFNSVQLVGEVNRPGFYDLGNGLKISQLIIKADGLTNDAYLGLAKVIIRKNGKDFKMKTVDLSKALLNDDNHDLDVVPGSRIEIFNKIKLRYYRDVFINGHVLRPGPRQYMEGMTLSDLIFDGGGFLNEKHLSEAYMERAEITRWDKSKFKRELIEFRLDSVLVGKEIANLEIQMGDSVRIYSNSEVQGYIAPNVKITGYVKRPGTYPLTDNLKIIDLLFLAGGFEDEAHINTTFLDRADLIRYNDDYVTKKLIRFNLENVLNDKLDSNVLLQPGDEITIYPKSFFNIKQKVTITGSIKIPGEYDLKESMSLKDLILEAGGVGNEYSTFKAEISRRVNNNKGQKKYSNIIEKYYDNNEDIFKKKNIESNNIELRPFDVVTVVVDPFSSKMQTVNIDGFIKLPGNYILNTSDVKVTDIIQRAGGIREEAYPQASRLIRDGKIIKLSFEKIIKRPSSYHNFNLLPGDSLLIGARKNIVVIEGEVNSPGNYSYYENYRYNDYIKMAGGYTRDAAKRASFVKYVDGRSIPINILGSPKIEDSCIISVGKKEEVEPFSITEYITNLTSIYADLTQALLLVNLARQN